MNIHPYAQFIGVQHPPTDERYSFAQSLVYAAARILELVHHTYNLWAGKKIKTKSGKKSLPIHQGLIQLFVWETAIWQNTFYREENRKKFAISPLSLLFTSFNMVHWRWSMPAATSETRTLNKVRYYFFCSFVLPNAIERVNYTYNRSWKHIKILTLWPRVRARAKCELPHCALGAISFHCIFLYATAFGILLYFFHRDYCMCYMLHRGICTVSVGVCVHATCGFHSAHMVVGSFVRAKVWRSRKWKLICCGTKSASNKVNGKWPGPGTIPVCVCAVCTTQ